MNKLLISLLISVGITGVAHAAGGNATAGASKVAVCAACHGADGNSPMGAFPSLAGQNSRYLLKQMQDQLSGARVIPEMTGLLNNLSDQDLRDIAAFYANQRTTIGQADAELVEKGRKIYEAGIADKGVSACIACHMPNGQGNNPARFPALSGQHPEYTLLQLQKFASEDRANDPNRMMRDIAVKMTESEMRAVSQYIRGLY
ncbi:MULTISPECIES: c-type cytochrome [Nitrincola]|uniref:Cytochrome c4 n=1 Tax=Nitrincola nitratireducens TaxID=1229521 RepID=W9URW7_9GAMM|nr:MULTISPECIES: cytochrome c4 [Nitrincola]EXJ09814.1 Cytochrome c4 precursor [Nitrincola nitratireducens]